VAKQSFATTAIWKAENAALRGYKHRRVNKPGERTHITKARVVDDVELREKEKIAEERAAKALAAAQRKKAKQQLAARHVSIITLGDEITDDEN